MNVLFSVKSFDKKYNEDRSVYFGIFKSTVNGRPENQLMVCEVKTALLGKSRGQSLGYTFSREIFRKYNKRRNTDEDFLVLGHRSVFNGEYVMGGKIVFENEYQPKELVAYIKTRGESEIVEKSIPFPMEFFEIKDDKFDFEKELKKSKTVVDYICANDAFFNEKCVVVSIENGKFGSNYTKGMVEGKWLHICEVSKYSIATLRGKRSLGKVFSLNVNQKILDAKKNGQKEVELGKFEHQGYSCGGKFSFEDNYDLKDVTIWMKPRGMNAKFISKSVPFPKKELWPLPDTFNVEEGMDKHEKLGCKALVYIYGKDAKYYERIIYITVEKGTISSSRLGAGRHQDNLLVCYSMRSVDVGKFRGKKLGTVFSLQLKEKIQQAKKQGKSEVVIGEFAERKAYPNMPYVVGGKVTFDGDGKPQIIAVYYQGRGSDESMRENSVDFSTFDSVEKEF